MKILQIDDNADTLEPIQLLFENMGFEYENANNGKDGLALIKKNDYDIVLLDLTMPGFSGYDVMKALEIEWLMKNQKIVLFSGYHLNDAEVEELTKKGVHSILQKPIDMDHLETKILDIMKGHKILMKER